jgi:GNAT superfamily N-acetyltransferase
MMKISIRQISIDDATAIVGLSHQLGYPITVSETTKNISAILANKDHDAFVAVHESKPVGWIGVFYAIQLESPPWCEIRGLVVDEQYRGKGIGKMLIEKAKQWGKEKGNSKLRLRCNVKRKETHLFYQHLGFDEMKEQKVFEINI